MNICESSGLIVKCIVIGLPVEKMCFQNIIKINTEGGHFSAYKAHKAKLSAKPTIAGADPGFDQGSAPDRDRPKLPTVHSSVMRAKRALFSMGSGACLRAPEALGYFITNMHSLHFGVPFYTIFEIIKY